LATGRALLLDTSAYREDRLQADHGGEGEIVPARWLRMEVRAEGARIGRSASFPLQKSPTPVCG
jgi:hypothetical protein